LNPLVERGIILVTCVYILTIQAMKTNEIKISKILEFNATAGFGRWKKYFSKNSVAHPAKMNLNLLEYLILRYTKGKELLREADTILDPMAGTYSTIVMVMLNGRNGIGVELEDKFYNWGVEAITNVENEEEQELTPKGKGIAIKGDARNLSELLKEHEEEIDACLFSPPYTGRSEHRIGYDYQKRDKERGEKEYKGFREGYSDNENNIGNLPMGDVDVVLTSPPYSEGTGHGKGKSNILNEKKLYLHGVGSYSEEKNNIGEIKVHGEIDLVLTSPPYSSSKSGGEADEDAMAERWDRIAKEKDWNTWGKTWTTEGRKRALKSLGSGYSDNKDNIGNLKKETYLEAMQAVYAECYKVLKEEGLLILVLKNFIRDKKVVPLTEHTIKLCESVGFKLKERLLFKLPSQSFWRILYKKKYPEVDVSDLDYEHILVFEKLNTT